DYYINAGLFADNAGFETTSQIFIDCKAPYYDLANDTPKLTEAEFLEMVGAAG
ncbi:GFA family protein, partial [Neisseria sp. P0021.S004]